MSYKNKEWLKAKFISIEKLSDLTNKFIIEFNNDFHFIPGQFITIKVNDVKRSYSIASFLEYKKYIELIIVNVDGGLLTDILFNNISVGDELYVKGQVGKFILPENIDRDFFFICTGTGLAPFRSFLDKMILDKKYPARIFLIFGTRTSNDLLCYNQMLIFSKKIPNFNYIPVLSRENWNGKQGYVHDIYKKIIDLEDLKNPLFYLCGRRNMIKDARNNLKDMGYDSKQIKLEIYD